MWFDVIACSDTAIHVCSSVFVSGFQGASETRVNRNALAKSHTRLSQLIIIRLCIIKTAVAFYTTVQYFWHCSLILSFVYRSLSLSTTD